MKYTDLQRRLKQYQNAGLVKVKLNSSLPVLEAEDRRCLQLGRSQSHLELTAIANYEYLEFISPLEIEANPNQFPLRIIKAKAYDLDRVEDLAELKLAFPIFKDRQYDFRTKVARSQCVYSIDRMTKDSQAFDKFKFDVEAFITAIKKGKYYQLTGDAAVAEAYEDLSSYISWWKGAQWEFTRATKASTLDLLKRAWLEQYLTENNLARLLEYTPID